MEIDHFDQVNAAVVNNENNREAEKLVKAAIATSEKSFSSATRRLA